MTELEQLRQRVQALEAKEQVAAVMAEYLYQVDHDRDPETLGGLFSADAVWEARGNLAEMGTTRSRAAIVDMLVGLPSSLSFTVHFVTNPLISVSADATTARGRWYALEVMSTAGEQPAHLVCVALYDNDFVRVGDAWQLRHVRFEDAAVFPYDRGWGDVRYVSLLTGRETGWVR